MSTIREESTHKSGVGPEPDETTETSLMGGFSSSSALPDWLPMTEFEGWVVPTLGGIPLLRLLGRGGMGSVYYGHNPRLNHPVAVKILPWSLSNSSRKSDAIDRFVREGQVALEIDSPYLVRLYEIGEERGLLYLVFEYINGCSAAEYLKRCSGPTGPGISERDALEIVIAAARGLAELHSRSIVHRDIKPANLFMVYDRAGDGRFDLTRTKLGDLGVVHTGEQDCSLTATNVAIGTPGFMAPEQTQDAKNAGPPADVFSLGTTLYTLLRGRPPFEGESPVAVLMATLRENPLPIRTIRPDVSIGTAQLLQKCMEKEPGKRHAHATELLEDLLHCRTARIGKRRVLGSGARKPERRRASLSHWAVGRSGWTRLPFFGALAWCGERQMFSPEHTGPLHAVSRAAHELGHTILAQSSSDAIHAMGGIALPFLLSGITMLIAIRRAAWFALSVFIAVTGACLHHAAQYALTAAVPGASPGAFEAPGTTLHDWRWILSQVGLLDHAPALAGVLGDLGNLVFVCGAAGCAMILLTLFCGRSSRPR
ncbi:MAG: serine/threonine-protein kinase [Planctomycetota bacterium]